MAKKNPLALTVLAVLALLLGLVSLIAGLLWWLGYNMLSWASTTEFWFIEYVAWIFVAVGLLYIFIAWGLYTKKWWAWWITIILTGVSLLNSLLSMNIVTILIALVIIIALLKKDVVKACKIKQLCGVAWE